jgi:uncharacterized protein (TIGR02301 family)
MKRGGLWLACAVIGMALGPANGAGAQPAPDGPPPAATVPVVAPADPADLLALSFVLGRAHGLRVGCNGRVDQVWRDYMTRFVDIEAASQPDLRNRMIEAFNQGYRQEQGTVAAGCGPAASAIEARLAAEGRRLADRLAQRYFQ